MTAFRILSLDGGGMKGLFAASFLAKTEELLTGSVADYFDLIVGTSTGGIIALGLGLDYRPDDIVEFYLEHGRTIFPQSGPLSRVYRKAKGFFQPRYEVGPLEQVLKQYFGAKRLGESRVRLVIPAFNATTCDVHLYKTAHHHRLREDYRLAAWTIDHSVSEKRHIALLRHRVVARSFSTIP